MADERFEAALRHAEVTGDWRDVIAAYIAQADRGGPGEAFYLTHAYVHALEAGNSEARALKARLVALGADVPDGDPCC